MLKKTELVKQLLNNEDLHMYFVHFNEVIIEQRLSIIIIIIIIVNIVVVFLSYRSHIAHLEFGRNETSITV
jgi:hypothetical protein